MEKENLKQFREIFQEEFRKGFEESFKKGFHESFGSIWQDNLEPALKSIHKKIANLPDKAYLDNKLADLAGRDRLAF